MKEVIAIYQDTIWILKKEDKGFIFRRSVFGLSGFYGSQEECIEGAKSQHAKVYIEV